MDKWTPKPKLFKYEIVYCTESSETVVCTFLSKHSDLTAEDDRTPYAIGSQEYLRGVE